MNRTQQAVFIRKQADFSRPVLRKYWMISILGIVGEMEKVQIKERQFKGI